MTKKIKIFDPVIGRREEVAVKKVLQSRFWASSNGEGKVLEFEKKFCQYVKSNECVAVDSGTAALHLALSLFNIKNKEVILPSLSFVSLAHAVIYNGGKPVFVDIDPATLCIDPTLIKKSLSTKTKVILPVHFAGLSCNLDEIIEICDEYGLDIVEDAALSTGSSYKNRKIGSHGTAVCFSFHPVKNLAMPKGGAITLNGKNSSRFKKILVARRWCGISNKTKTKYVVDQLGWNYYMNQFSAAIGVEQLKKMDMMIAKRRKVAKKYFDHIEVDYKMPFDNECSYNFYWILVKKRNSFIKKMEENNIEVGTYHTPIHKLHFYAGKARLPNTEKISEQLVGIPTHPNLTESDVDKIIKLVNQFSKHVL